MPDPVTHVGSISSIGPIVFDPDRVLSTTVTFADGTVTRVLSTTFAAEGLIGSLRDLLSHEALVYVEMVAGSITRVLGASVGWVRSLELDSGGHTLVEMDIASSFIVLKRTHKEYPRFLLLMELSLAERKPIVVTVAPITREVLDVRDLPSGPADAGEGAPMELAGPADPCAAIAPIDQASADRAFAGIVALQCDDTVAPPNCIPLRYVDKYCQARAHKIAGLLLDAGIQSCKVWAYGPLGAYTPNEPGCYVKWDLRHVGPAVRVGDHVSSQVMIFDPSLFENGPVPLATWLQNFDPPPFATRCTSCAVLDQPYSSGPDFDENGTKTEGQLALARTDLREQIQRFGAPPYNCPAHPRAPIGADDTVVAGEITRLLAQVRDGDLNAREILCEKVYAELHRLASAHLRRERPGHLLQPTLLVHDAYLGLVRQDMTYNDRRHFFAVASGMMRRLLVDHARAAKAEKRGGGIAGAPLDDRIQGLEVSIDDVLSVDEALEKLRTLDERQVRIVEMKIFAGLSEEDIAEVLEVSSRTVKREWKAAKVWLAQQLRPQ